MAAKSLRCVAVAYRTCEVDEVPTDEEQLEQWTLPEDDLILLAIVGIKVVNPIVLIISKYSVSPRTHSYKLNSRGIYYSCACCLP